MYHHNTFRVHRAVTIDRLEGISDTKESSILKLHFQDGTYVVVLRQDADKLIAALSELFGVTPGKWDLQEKIHGQRVVYCMDQRQVLQGFTPYSKWPGAEMEDGNFLIDTDGGCCEEFLDLPEIPAFKQLEMFGKEHVFRGGFKFGIDPGGDLPEKPPTSALYLGSASWSFNMGGDRDDSYYISRTKDRKRWLLWVKFYDEMDGKNTYMIYCMASADYKTRLDAARDMLEQAWTRDKLDKQLDNGPDNCNDGALDMWEMADKIWDVEE